MFFTIANPEDKPVDINNPGPAASKNPDNSTAPSHDLPMRGSDNQEKKGRGKVKSTDQGDKPDLNDMQWFLGGLDVERDEHTGFAKWPLSFKRISKDVKRDGAPYKGQPTSPKGIEQPPRAV